MKEVKISHTIPPIYEELHNRFGVEWENGIIIAWDNKIHCSEDFPLAPQKIIHESKHLERQNEIGNDAWWRLYLESEQFRRNEEMIAYLAEANFIKKNIKNREISFFAIRDIAKSFSSDVYGNIISLEDALKILR